MYRGGAGPARPSVSSRGPPPPPPGSLSAAGNRPPPRAVAYSHGQPAVSQVVGLTYEVTMPSPHQPTSGQRESPRGAGRGGACFPASGLPRRQPLFSRSPEPRFPGLKPSSSIANCRKGKIERGKENQFAQREEASPRARCPLRSRREVCRAGSGPPSSPGPGWGAPSLSPAGHFASRRREPESHPGRGLLLGAGLLGPLQTLEVAVPLPRRDPGDAPVGWLLPVLDWLRPLPGSGQRDAHPLPLSLVTPGATRTLSPRRSGGPQV